jgi:1-acyl-sn-glycerol-3-phosphate acyltransferase
MNHGLSTIRAIVRLFNIHVEVKNKPAADEVFLLVSNHMGFLDILALASILPNLFVTSREMRETPVLGLLTEMAGCMYVERRSRLKTVEEMKSVAKALNQGFRVVLYPEATSTNGEQVLPFKRTLMMAAAEAHVPIQPAVINFKEINGEAFTLKWRDHVCWYGEMGFGESAWRAMTLRSLTIQVEFLEKIYPTPTDDRAAVADKAHDMIAAKFRPVIMDPTGIPASVSEADPV